MIGEKNMIVINKKRLEIILSAVIIGILAFTFQTSGNNGKSDGETAIQDDSNIVAVTSTPVSGKTIVVDAGHGTPDERRRE